MIERVELKGLTWDDPRGYGPLKAVESAYNAATTGPAVSISWTIQPLGGFESRPLVEVFGQFDLIVADHPHMADAAELDLLCPIDDLSHDYVGLTRESYRYGEHFFAVPVDAGCHVAAYHPDRIKAAPRSWNGVEQLVQEGARVATPLAGVHSLMALLALIASERPADMANFVAFTQDEVSAALNQLRWLKSICLAESLEWNPIEALQALADDKCDYVPITFGYAHFQSCGIRFHDLPAKNAHGRGRGILGGAGMAVSAVSRHADVAKDFCRFCGSSEVQSSLWPTSGGQPAHRAAWNALATTNPFYRDTRLAMGTAQLRPRCPGFNDIQSAVGSEIHSWLADGNPSDRRQPSLERLQNAIPCMT